LNRFTINIDDYDYSLPNERIAKYPLDKRENSKLLIFSPGHDLVVSNFHSLSDYLPQESMLIYNNTRVIHARLMFQKTTGANIEIFCLAPDSPSDYQQSLGSSFKCTWKCLVGNSKKWKDEPLWLNLHIKNEEIKLTAKRSQHNDTENHIIEFNWTSQHSFAEILEAAGRIPIPPYLNRDSEEIDNNRYQTIYSEHMGSVAAPTAGLHFSKNVFEQLREKKILVTEVTLHVGAGTFKPVKAINAREHIMHDEQIIIRKKLLEELLSYRGKIIATGTTTLRALESIYWLGIKALNHKNTERLGQWEWEEMPQNISLKTSIRTLLQEMENLNTDIMTSYTSIMIVPGYTFKVVDGLITNFHQPKSTLLLLIAAFTDNKWNEIYNYALDNNFRFLSYGDSSLLFR
jgi:S-adenosylmethionine:tRNA ribosyltransferase-isomerase